MIMMSPSKAKYMLAAKARLGTTKRAYYSVGVQVPPRHGSVFSMRYTTVPSARAGWALLRQKMARKKVGMVGELALFNEDATATVSLGGYIRRSGGVLERFAGDGNRRAIGHAYRAAANAGR
jgi:hypothetical protein